MEKNVSYNQNSLEMKQPTQGDGEFPITRHLQAEAVWYGCCEWGDHLWEEGWLVGAGRLLNLGGLSSCG